MREKKMKFLKKAGLIVLMGAGLIACFFLVLFVVYLAFEYTPDTLRERNSRNAEQSYEEDPDNIEDWLYEEHKSDATIYVFQMDGRTYTVDGIYEVDLYMYDSLSDGCFYEVVADVTFLNGGVAGYVDYPKIESIISCDEISPFELNLPSVKEKRYGLISIGDYADGDIFLNEYGKMAVFKDGEWVWHYDKGMKREDGTYLCYKDGVTEEEMQESIDRGILSCEEYFLLPAIKG